MSDTHNVHFTPVDIDIEVGEDETVLDAAFRQGVMLMHGCKEGQCSACKSFLLDGDVQMDRYSTFALADYESDEGYVLLCRAHAYSDLDVELINYDEEMIRSGLPVTTVGTTITSITALSHDITELVLHTAPGDAFRYYPGQYVDVQIPGHHGHRSFSMASPPTPEGQLKLIIKRYPGGHFSGLLEGGLTVGDPLSVTGPYGTFTLRAGSERRLVLAAGGAGMAPVLALLHQLADSGSTRGVSFYYGARTADDLICTETIRALAARLPQLVFVPCLSDSWPADWDPATTGYVHDVLDRHETELAGAEVYLCGPPPMIDAALARLAERGVPREQIFHDSFTITAESGS